MAKALQILERFWGYKSFRKNQDVIISSVLDGKDTLALLPTGGGKSICYQIPALANEGICLVISPLIALMQDQVKQLTQRGIKAVAINSSLSQKEIDILLDNAIYGNTKFLYVSPERLKSRLFLARLPKMNINLIAVDESHCISQWGYDFRPAYLEIAQIRKHHPNVPVLALTATATEDVVEDIQEKLKFKIKNVISSSFKRDNVIYNLNRSNNKINRIFEYLNDQQGSGIIYCSTRKDVKFVCKMLVEKGISASIYHGGLNAEMRSKHLEQWINDEVQIMVATNAFGMGIDKPNVRFVIHYDIPETIEAYFQEAGRAGRDGERAETHIFYESSDIEQLENRVRSKFPELDFIKDVYKALGNHFQLATGSGKDESFELNMLSFCDKYNFDLILAYNSLKFLELGEFIALSENFQSPSQLQIKTDAKELYQYQVRDEKLNKVVQFLLRTQMGIFEDPVKINEQKISKHTGITEAEIVSTLNELHQKELIQYIPQRNGTYVNYLTERLVDQNLSLPTEIYHQRKKVALDKLESMIAFLYNGECTSQYLLKYFGEKESERCGDCSECKTKIKEVLNTDINTLIKNYLNNRFNYEESILIQDVISEFKENKQEIILEEIRVLIDQKEIQVDTLGKTLSRH